jgi:hypothetical protein
MTTRFIPKKENLMASTLRSSDRRKISASSITGAKREPQKTIRRGLDRVTLGFWVGGVVLFTVGCILGGSQPYQHPAARMVSVAWWGIYIGCLGAGIGALLGLFTKPAAPPPAQEPDSAGQPLSDQDIDCGPCPTNAVVSVSRGGPVTSPGSSK